MMLKSITTGLAAMCLLAGCAAAPRVDPTQAPSAAPQEVEMLNAVREARIYFAHRSVGAEIVERGIPAVYERFDLPPLSVNEEATDGWFLETWLEQAEDPSVKLKSFPRLFEQYDIVNSADVAFMKMGYVDITADTDVAALFDDYRSMMAEMALEHPTISFLHVTVTPTRWVPAANAQIEAFNELMRAEYAQDGILIDLARELAHCPDGMIDRHLTGEGAPYLQICEAYTRDGGHLSDAGAAVAATEMLMVLGANLTS